MIRSSADEDLRKEEIHIKRLIHALDENLEEFLLILLLLAITITIFLQIIMRYFFTNSLSWVEEFSRYCFVWSGFLSLGYCVKKNQTLRVDILLYFLPKKGKAVIDMLGRIITLAFYVYALQASCEVVRKAFLNGQVTAAMEIPMYLINLAIPLGFALGILRQIQEFVLQWQKRKEREQ